MLINQKWGVDAALVTLVHMCSLGIALWAGTQLARRLDANTARRSSERPRAAMNTRQQSTQEDDEDLVGTMFLGLWAPLEVEKESDV
jgi:hypothetical protein